MASKVTNIVVAGLGGQGILTATDVLADAALRAGREVKKSEIKGMSQRGGSVTSDVRYGAEVLSPMVPPGEADYLLVLAAEQVQAHRHALRPGGTLITPEAVDPNALANRKAANVALLGCLSAHLDIPEEHWLAALRAKFPDTFFDANRQAFQLGRRSQQKTPNP
jgi:indolepyruvate ferredoxin oxidoreductase beta subunit